MPFCELISEGKHNTFLTIYVQLSIKIKNMVNVWENMVTKKRQLKLEKGLF